MRGGNGVLVVERREEERRGERRRGEESGERRVESGEVTVKDVLKVGGVGECAASRTSWRIVADRLVVH